MDTSFLIKGLIIGFLIACPVGPVNILCIRRTLTEGRIQGLISGLGAAAADTIYGFIAAFSLTFISDFLVKHQIGIRVVGAFFLCIMGIRIFLTKSTNKPIQLNSSNLIGNFGSTFIITLMNPISILAFTIVFASVGISHSSHTLDGFLVAGVFIGSSIWWLLLSGTAGFFHKRISPDNLLWLNKVSGIIINICGLLIFLDLKK